MPATRRWLGVRRADGLTSTTTWTQIGRDESNFKKYSEDRYGTRMGDERFLRHVQPVEYIDGAGYRFFGEDAVKSPQHHVSERRGSASA